MYQTLDVHRGLGLLERGLAFEVLEFLRRVRLVEYGVGREVVVMFVRTRAVDETFDDVLDGILFHFLDATQLPATAAVRVIVIEITIAYELNAARSQVDFDGVAFEAEQHGQVHFGFAHGGFFCLVGNVAKDSIDGGAVDDLDGTPGRRGVVYGRAGVGVKDGLLFRDGGGVRC